MLDKNLILKIQCINFKDCHSPCDRMEKLALSGSAIPKIVSSGIILCVIEAVQRPCTVLI